MDDTPLLLNHSVCASAVCSSDDFGGALVTLDDQPAEMAPPSLIEHATAAPLDSENEQAVVESPAVKLEQMTSRVIEALLFASDAPLSASKLAELAGSTNAAAVKSCVERLNAQYESAGRAFRIEEIARGYRLMTLPEFQPWLAKLNNQRAETRLSEPALETLSVIAYKQPIIRADIEAIRGVACGEVLNRLRELGLVRVVGRAEVVGRPMLFGTTRRFLDLFGLADLDDLPPMEALKLRPSAKATEPTANGAAREHERSGLRAAAGA